MRRAAAGRRAARRAAELRELPSPLSAHHFRPGPLVKARELRALIRASRPGEVLEADDLRTVLLSGLVEKDIRDTLGRFEGAKGNVSHAILCALARELVVRGKGLGMSAYQVAELVREIAGSPS
jgi:hypothetical protein